MPHPLISLRNIDPEDIPKDPSNSFLTRSSKMEEVEKKPDEDEDKDKKRGRKSRSKSRSRSPRDRGQRLDKNRDRGGNRDGGDRSSTRFGGAGTGRSIDNEGRKIKGRGRIVSHFVTLKLFFVFKTKFKFCIILISSASHVSQADLEARLHHIGKRRLERRLQ